MEALKKISSKGFTYPDIQLENDPYIKKIQKELLNLMSDSKGTVRNMCMHILESGGKKLRPLLVLHSGLIFSKMNVKLLCAAAAAELIHMASLVHDDIIDEADLRRGRFSANKKWGSHFAVLCGDYLFAKAFSTLSERKLMFSLACMVEAIQNMCCGEIQQAENRFRVNTSMGEYYDRIAKKTAVFLQCCCKSGAAVGGANEAQVESIAGYGLNLGYAFQIVDDILDFSGSSTVMGKPEKKDLVQGNITMPIILLLGSDKYGTWLRQIIKKKQFTDESMGIINSALKESGAIDRSFSIASYHIDIAKSCLNGIPDCKSTNLLYSLAETMRARIS